jgi:glycerol-3-phosphate dehydrogenase (NAD(P)+)
MSQERGQGKEQKRVCVLGSGIWGTAIAIQVQRVLGSCVIFTKNPLTLEDINTRHSNRAVSLSRDISAEIDFAKLNNYQSIIIAAPSYALDEIIRVFKGYPLAEEIDLIIATKGLDVKKTQLISTSINQEFSNTVMILSGPSFADEVISNQFTAISLAAQEIDKAREFIKNIGGVNFVVVPSGDIVGLQLSGCIKNVIAILVGMLRHLNYGDNICSAVIARGILDISVLSMAIYGGIDRSDYGSKLAIFGDMVLSCSSPKSRNMSFGMRLASGIGESGNLVEGKLAINALLAVAQNYDVSLKMVELVQLCLSNPLMTRRFIEDRLLQLV